jgi:hypothetical protein
VLYTDPVHPQTAKLQPFVSELITKTNTIVRITAMIFFINVFVLFD